MKRHELTEQQWQLIKPLLPAYHQAGGQWKNHRRFINGMLWRLGTGVPWRDLPPRYGPWNSVYVRFNHWCRNGLIEQIALVLQAELEAYVQIDWRLWCLDGSVIRATRAAAGARHDSEKKMARTRAPRSGKKSRRILDEAARDMRPARHRANGARLARPAARVEVRSPVIASAPAEVARENAALDRRR